MRPLRRAGGAGTVPRSPARRCAVPEAGQMEEAVQDENLDLLPEGVPTGLGLAGGRRHADDDVPEDEAPVRTAAAHGEAQDVGSGRSFSDRSC